MPFAQCPVCNRRNGSLVKVGKKYLHYRCRKDSNHSWKEEFAVPAYDAKPYAVFKYTSDSRKELIRSKKLETTLTKKLNIDSDIDYDYIALLNFFDSYQDAIVSLKKMNTPDRISFMDGFKIGN